MAALMEHVEFLKLSGVDEFQGVASCNEDDSVVVTCKTKGITIYKVNDQKPTKSWSVRRGLNLTNTTLWDSYQEQFVTVVNNQEYRSWKSDTTDFEKGKRKTFGFKLKEILAVPDYDIVAVCDNGDVGFLKTLKESQHHQKNDDRVIWCTACRLLNTLCVVCLVKSKDNVNVVVHQYSKDTEQWSELTSPLAVPEADPTVLCADCFSHQSSLTLHVLWSTGLLQSRRISPDGELSQIKTEHELPGIHGNCSMVAIDTSHVAVAGVQQDEEDGIAIFDARFGTLQSWRELPTALKQIPKLFCIQNHIFLALGKTLYSYRFRCELSTLASVLGQTAPLESTEVLQIHNTWSAVNQQKTKSDDTDKILKLFENIVKYETLTSFRKSFSSLMDLLKKESNSHLRKSGHMTQLVRTCLTMKKKWPSAELDTLISLKWIPQRLIGELVEKVVENCDTAILYKILSGLQDIPEKSICQALEYYLSLDDEDFKVCVEELKPDNYDSFCLVSAPLSRNKQFFVNHALSLPVSDAFLLECLRSMSFENTMKLLEHLMHYIEEVSSQLLIETSSVCQLSVLQAVEWLCLLLDAQMTHLAISPDAHSTVIKLHSIIAAKVQFFDELVSLEALLEQLKVKSNFLVAQKKIGPYCIEVLHMD